MEFQMRNKTFISSMVGVAAAVAVAGSASAGIVSASGAAFDELNIFASGVWGGTAGETAVAGYSTSESGSYIRYLRASYTSGSDGNFTESVPFIFQLFGQRIATPSTGFEDRFTTSTVNRVASGFMIDGSLGTLDSVPSSGWASTTSTQTLAVTYYRSSSTSFTVGSTTYAAGTYTGGQFYGQSGYFGFRFSTDGGTNWNYGWAFGTGGSGPGAPGFEISQWGYNTVVNQGIAAGAVPAPGALALLGLAGLAGGRRRRA
jgi:MYXO-CTERM domain-containing protein